MFFLGLRKDVPDLLSTFDLFLLPSKYEGLPVILVEAQASGITCCVSDSVTTEVNVTKNIRYISISQGITPWVTEIINIYNHKLFNIKLRKNALKTMKNGKFDIKTQENSLYYKYLRLLGIDE